MGFATAVTLLVLSFIFYVILRNINLIFADVFLFIAFIFAWVLTGKEFGAFYILLLIIAIVIDLAIPQFSFQPAKNAFGFSGTTLTFVSLIAGLVLYLIISVISIRVGGNIVGAPTLAVTSTNAIAQNLRPTFVGLLGIIENKIAFAFFEVLNIFGVLIPLIGIIFSLIPFLMPVIIVGLIMGLFHVTAYSVAVSLLIWASMAFMLFIASYIIMSKDSLAADTAHYINNTLIDINRGLAIVT